MTTTVEQSSQKPETQQEPSTPTPQGLRSRVSSFLMSHVRQSGMVVALALGLCAQYAARPTETEMYEFRDRLCSGYEPGE